MPKFTEYLSARGQGKEPSTPWHLHDKLKCYNFCESLGIPTVRVLRRFDHPSKISLADLPINFVLKPTYHSSSIGVMVLARNEDGTYRNSMKSSETSLTEEEIVSRQQEIHDAHQKTGIKETIVEERIEDLAGRPIPRDYKAYAFQGEIPFILELDRNGPKTSVAWFDGNFNPLRPGRIETNEQYLARHAAARPEQWEALLNAMRRASVAVPAPFASIDMYESTRGPLLGEVTLVPGGFYFGKYFVPSEAEDWAAGRLWEDALRKLGRQP